MLPTHPITPDEPYRVERKYYISLETAARLREKLSRIMRRDPHADAFGRYLISSVYFDTPENAALWAADVGQNLRIKYRIRAYNHDDGFISLECKMKRGSLSTKTHFRVTREDADKLLSCDPSPLLSYDNDLARAFYADMRLYGFRPTGVVEYLREVYIHPIEDTRITFDMNLSGALVGHNLFNPGATYPILPHDVVLLEVKYQHFLPDFIARVLPTDMMPATSNCKYARARVLQ